MDLDGAAADGGGLGVDVDASMVVQARDLLATQTSQPEGADDVKPLATLDFTDQDLVTLLSVCIDLRDQLHAKRADNDETALCVGITAPAGSGKSTIVHVVKLFLKDILSCGFVQEISQVRLCLLLVPLPFYHRYRVSPPYMSSRRRVLRDCHGRALAAPCSHRAAHTTNPRPCVG